MIKFLLCLVFLIAGASLGDTCASRKPSCPSGQLLMWGGCRCTGGGNSFCKQGYKYVETNPATCICKLQTRTALSIQDDLKCSSFVQQLAFKSSMACVQCTSNNCIHNRTAGFHQLLGNENDCNQILDCLKTHASACGCNV